MDNDITEVIVPKHWVTKNSIIVISDKTYKIETFKKDKITIVEIKPEPWAKLIII